MPGCLLAQSCLCACRGQAQSDLFAFGVIELCPKKLIGLLMVIVPETRYTVEKRKGMPDPFRRSGTEKQGLFFKRGILE